MPKITKTSELREYLLKAIDDVATGALDIEKARNIVKLSGQVHESLYSEVRVAKTMVELGSESAKFGTLPLDGPLDESS